MSKILLLNGTVKTLKNETLIAETGRYIPDENGRMTPEVLPIRFVDTILNYLLEYTTESDEETLSLYKLAMTLQDLSTKQEESRITVSQKEFDIINGFMKYQPLIIKARFLQMVEKENAVATIPEPIIAAPDVDSSIKPLSGVPPKEASEPVTMYMNPPTP